jgi:hypothetical protein
MQSREYFIKLALISFSENILIPEVGNNNMKVL